VRRALADAGVAARRRRAPTRTQHAISLAESMRRTGDRRGPSVVASPSRGGIAGRRRRHRHRAPRRPSRRWSDRRSRRAVRRRSSRRRCQRRRPSRRRPLPTPSPTPTAGPVIISRRRSAARAHAGRRTTSSRPRRAPGHRRATATGARRDARPPNDVRDPRRPSHREKRQRRDRRPRRQRQRSSTRTASSAAITRITTGGATSTSPATRSSATPRGDTVFYADSIRFDTLTQQATCSTAAASRPTASNAASCTSRARRW
jgi:hypothetical protein